MTCPALIPGEPPLSHLRNRAATGEILKGFRLGSPSLSFAVRNHYVPQWYQKRFLASGRTEDKLYYLDLNPERVVRPDGRHYYQHARRRLGPASCFVQNDLYTLTFGKYATDVIEKNFFGEIDDKGSLAIEFFHDYELRTGADDAWNDLMKFMDAQKLRTPKGLDFLRKLTGATDHQKTLTIMGNLFQMHVTLWTEGVWEIICCDESPTKFVISDHPVATYNKGHFPGSPACTYPLDSPVESVGTHIIFPLDLDRCLVITSLGYVRNPKINLVKQRVNPRYFQNSMFDLRKIQTGRQVPEDYVRAINYVIKNRARRYIAAGEREWLYPEEHLPTRMWNKLGGKDFLMPDPRKVTFTTDFVVGFKDGSAWGHDEYGRLSDENDSKVKRLRDKEWDTFQTAKKPGIPSTVRWTRRIGRNMSSVVSV